MVKPKFNKPLANKLFSIVFYLKTAGGAQLCTLNEYF
jgi:hypothetical protein